jgi:hypothetical protein
MEGESQGSYEILKTPVGVAQQLFQELPSKLWPKAFPHFVMNYQQGKGLVASAKLLRQQMPVVNDSDYSVLKQVLGMGVRSSTREMRPEHLKPLQKQIYLSKIVSYLKRPEVKDIDSIYHSPILISGDHHIIDGHHRWLEAMLMDHPINVVEINLTTAALFLMSVGLSDTEQHRRNA